MFTQKYWGHEAQEVRPPEPVTEQPGQTIAECMHLMHKQRNRLSPWFVGLISRRGVMQAIISEQQDDIQRLESMVLSDEHELLA